MAAPFPDHPQLRGNYAPISIEADAHDLVVRGSIPADLAGTLYRNGPNPQFAPRGHHHWFGGDGMVHAFHIENGRVSYRNRWVRTPKFEWERAEGRALFDAFNPMNADPEYAGRDSTIANTNIVWHGGKLLCLEEGHAPFEIDPQTLDAVGLHTYDGRLQGPMTAHPKIDPENGEMLFFGYMAGGPFSPDINYHVVNADGELVDSQSFQAPFPSMVHDFITTRDHIIFPIFPLTGSLDRAMNGKPPFAWEPDKGTHIGIMPRGGKVEDIRWFEADPCYVFHPMNAYSDGDTVVADVMQFEAAPLFPNPDGSHGDPNKAQARLTRWNFDLAANTSSFKQVQLDDAVGEFPRLDERRTGIDYRYGSIACSLNRRRGDQGIMNTVAWYDLQTDRRDVHEFGAGDGISEPVFVPRSESAPEGDGYLLTVVYRAEQNRSDLVILDTQNVGGEPVAVAELPHRVPYGFHGNWRPAD